MQFTYPFIKEVQATREVFIPQKRTSSTSKLEFSSLLWFILTLLDPDPDPADQKKGSATLVKTNFDQPDEYVVLFEDRSNFLDDTGRAQGVQQLKLYSA